MLSPEEGLGFILSTSSRQQPSSTLFGPSDPLPSLNCFPGTTRLKGDLDRTVVLVFMHDRCVGTGTYKQNGHGV